MNDKGKTKKSPKPGKNILFTGIVFYIVIFLVSFFAPPAGEEGLGGLILLSPILLLIMGVLLFLPVFMIGTITGIPYISFSYGFLKAKYHWRTILGIILIISVSIIFILKTIHY